ncbi:MAG: CRISPR-associated helicase Cas3' [Gammaproteobacteria bacterium]
MNKYIAHSNQSLIDHLNGVGDKSKCFAAKINVGDVGQLIGLLHDFGKFSEEFQNYIQSAVGEINPDEDEYVDFRGRKGKIDHSTAGAQIIWDYCKNKGKSGQLVGQILSLCIASHHSGLIDCFKPDGKFNFDGRINKPDDKTHKTECVDNAPKEYLEKIDTFLNKKLLGKVVEEINKLASLNGSEVPLPIWQFHQGLWARMLFSCLVDADRIDSADSENEGNTRHRNCTPEWQIAIHRIEEAIRNMNRDKPIDSIRRQISDDCKRRADDKQGVYTLTVPTGGGKTYASLRYALHHAEKHGLDRIIYVIPFTSIIEQNAKAIRELIEHPSDPFPWVLEQHSNLEPENQTWHSKLTSENWDAPIIMTTMVQFLDVLFSGGTRGARKMHQLANSVLIFDEIQTLPINCVHLFCNAINFLTEYCKATTLLCTATQPLLNRLKCPDKGQIYIPSQNELAEDTSDLFKKLQRTTIANKCKASGWRENEIANLAIAEFKAKGSCLVIVNTKAWAQNLYRKVSEYINGNDVFHLSTNLCPAHRKDILDKIRKRLDEKLPVLCISTQLIEAGVDIDFASVIRFLAGLDSVAQAAGRCNRNGLMNSAEVTVINPDQESIDLLPDIKVGRDKAMRVLDEPFDDFLAPDAIERYFKYYFFDRSNEMAYLIPRRETGRDDTLLNLLGGNRLNTGGAENSHLLRQSFMTAGKVFKAIDSPTKAVIVPYGSEGAEVRVGLCQVAKEFDAKRYRDLLKKAQRYSVNVFPKTWERLKESEAVLETQEGEGIFFLKEEYYCDELGLSEQKRSKMSFLLAE